MIARRVRRHPPASLKAFMASATITVAFALLSSRSDAVVCIPGAQVACACPGGTSSVQVCLADGSGLGLCQCNLAPPATPPVAAPPTPTPTPATAASGTAATVVREAPMITLMPQPTSAPLSPALGPSLPPAGASGADTSRKLGTQKILALALGGVGVVGLGVGTAIGVVALSNRGSAAAACPNNVCGTLAEANKFASANSTGNAATVALIVGGAALVGGGVLWFTAPKAKDAGSTRVGLGPGSVQLVATW
jgi:hypothetical protein